MLGIGSGELIVIIIVAVLVLGPEHLPRILRTVQKVMSDFRRVSTEFQRIINLEGSLDEYARNLTTIKTPPTTKKKKKKKAKPSTAENGDNTPTAKTSETPAEHKEETGTAASSSATETTVKAALPNTDAPATATDSVSFSNDMKISGAKMPETPDAPSSSAPNSPKDAV